MGNVAGTRESKAISSACKVHSLHYQTEYDGKRSSVPEMPALKRCTIISMQRLTLDFHSQPDMPCSCNTQ
eukprot:scaffold5855_cov19-Prasinocladus_malaysianus.AAC.1